MTDPTVSVLVPTFKRPDLLHRNLMSCAEALAENKEYFEVVVGDNAASAEVREMVHAFSGDSGIRTRYLGEPTTPNMQENHRRLAEAARGHFLNFVHDDDYLLPSAGSLLLEAIEKSPSPTLPIKNAVHLVDIQGKVRRTDGVGDAGFLSPRQAVHRLVTNSSFIRFPCMLIPKRSYLEIGGFDASLGNLFDLGAWLSLASNFGLFLSGRVTCAFTIHQASETNSMFTTQFLEQIEHLISFHGKNAGLSECEMRKSASAFLWRFTLAGCKRAASTKNWVQLRERISLFSTPPVSEYPCPMQWLPIKWTFLLLFCLSLERKRAREFS